jgi:hypothetical protein
MTHKAICWGFTILVLSITHDCRRFAPRVDSAFGPISFSANILSLNFGKKLSLHFWKKFYPWILDKILSLNFGQNFIPEFWTKFYPWILDKILSLNFGQNFIPAFWTKFYPCILDKILSKNYNYNHWQFRILRIARTKSLTIVNLNFDYL